MTPSEKTQKLYSMLKNINIINIHETTIDALSKESGIEVESTMSRHLITFYIKNSVTLDVTIEKLGYLASVISQWSYNRGLHNK